MPSRKTMAVVGATLGIVAGVKLFLAALAGHHVYTFSTPLPVVLLGTIIGLTYGLLAVGLVLIYRTNRIINFAHGQIGAFGAAVFGLAVVKYGVPYWVMFPAALAASGAVGAAAEATADRSANASAPAARMQTGFIGLPLDARHRRAHERGAEIERRTDLSTPLSAESRR